MDVTFPNRKATILDMSPGLGCATATRFLHQYGVSLESAALLWEAASLVSGLNLCSVFVFDKERRQAGWLDVDGCAVGKDSSSLRDNVERLMEIRT